MSRPYSHRISFVILALGLAGACSSDEDIAIDSIDCIAPDDGGRLVTPVARNYALTCPLAGFPFAASAGAVSIRDATVSVSQPARAIPAPAPRPFQGSP